MERSHEHDLHQRNALLTTAEAILNRDGWCRRYRNHPKTGAHCIMGALETAQTEGKFTLDDLKAATDAVVAYVRPTTIPITYWNDDLQILGEYRVKRALRKAKAQP